MINFYFNKGKQMQCIKWLVTINYQILKRFITV